MKINGISGKQWQYVCIERWHEKKEERIADEIKNEKQQKYERKAKSMKAKSQLGNERKSRNVGEMAKSRN